MGNYTSIIINMEKEEDSSKEKNAAFRTNFEVAQLKKENESLKKELQTLKDVIDSRKNHAELPDDEPEDDEHIQAIKLFFRKYQTSDKSEEEQQLSSTADQMQIENSSSK